MLTLAPPAGPGSPLMGGVDSCFARGEEQLPPQQHQQQLDQCHRLQPSLPPLDGTDRTGRPEGPMQSCDHVPAAQHPLCPRSPRSPQARPENELTGDHHHTKGPSSILPASGWVDPNALPMDLTQSARRHRRVRRSYSTVRGAAPSDSNSNNSQFIMVTDADGRLALPAGEEAVAPAHVTAAMRSLRRERLHALLQQISPQAPGIHRSTSH